MSTNKRAKRAAALAVGWLALAIFLGVGWPISEHYGFSDLPKAFAIPLSVLDMSSVGGLMAIPIGGACFGAAIVMWLLKRPRHETLLLLYIGSAALAGISALFSYDPWPARYAATARMAKRAEPIVDALELYRHAHGRYPEKLGVLVPHYLKAILGTGAIRYPEFRYLPLRPGEGDGYMLSVSVTYLLSFDWIEYRSSRDYSRHGTAAKRIGDWVYVHE